MKKKKEAYTVQLDPDFVGKIDAMADKYGMSRSQLMGNLLEMGFEDVVILDRLGLIKVGRAIVDLRDKYFPKIMKAKEEDNQD